MVVGLQTEKDLEDERRRRASVLSLLSLSLTDRFPEKILQIECLMEGQRLGAEYRPRKIETQSSDTESSQKEVLCRGWRELGPAQNPVAHHGKGLRLVRRGHRRWLTVFYLSDKRKPVECSTGDTIHVLESVKKYAVVNRVKGSWKIQECQKRNIAGVKCKKDVICYLEKGCFSAMVRVVSRLRTDEIVFSEVGCSCWRTTFSVIFDMKSGWKQARSFSYYLGQEKLSWGQV